MKLKRTGTILAAVALAFGGSMLAAPAANAAYGTYCTIYAYSPTTDGVKMYSKGSAYCNAGYVVGVGANSQKIDYYGGWVDANAMGWGWTAGAASFAHTTAWTCNGIGTNLSFRSKATGQNNSSETATTYGSAATLTC